MWRNSSTHPLLSERDWQFLKKLAFPRDPAIPLTDVHVRESKTHIPQRLYMKICIIITHSGSKVE
jgi:hypothetical protein